jgi:hypothetical protein
MKAAEAILYVNPQLEQLRQLVSSSRAQLADLQARHTKEKARTDAVQAILFHRLREFYQKRDRLRLVVDFRRRYLDSLLGRLNQNVNQLEEDFARAKSQTNRDYEETAKEMDKKKDLSAEEEAELTNLWKQLVKLYHPDRFAHEPDKLETYHKLTSAINQAKDNGSIKTLREIAEDPHGFILRRGWTILDFAEDEEMSLLQKLHDMLQQEIVSVITTLNHLHESAEYKLCLSCERKKGALEEIVAERAVQVEKENLLLEGQADQLSEEIKELAGNVLERIA